MSDEATPQGITTRVTDTATSSVSETPELQATFITSASEENGCTTDLEVYTHAELERASKATAQDQKRPQPIVYISGAQLSLLRELQTVINLVVGEGRTYSTKESVAKILERHEAMVKTRAVATTPTPTTPTVPVGGAQATGVKK